MALRVQGKPALGCGGTLGLIPQRGIASNQQREMEEPFVVLGEALGVGNIQKRLGRQLRVPHPAQGCSSPWLILSGESPEWTRQPAHRRDIHLRGSCLEPVHSRRGYGGCDAASLHCKIFHVTKRDIDDVIRLQWQVGAFAFLHISQGKRRLDVAAAGLAN